MDQTPESNGFANYTTRKRENEEHNELSSKRYKMEDSFEKLFPRLEEPEIDVNWDYVKQSRVFDPENWQKIAKEIKSAGKKEQISFDFRSLPIIQIPQNLKKAEPPKMGFEIKMKSPTYNILHNGSPICFYCGKVFLNIAHKQITEHLKEEATLTNRISIPIFSIVDSDGGIKKCFIKDSFGIGGIPSPQYTKFKNTVKTRLKDNLMIIDSKNPLFLKIPQTFRLHKNHKISIHEFNLVAYNVLEDSLPNHFFDFIDTNYLIN